MGSDGRYVDDWRVWKPRRWVWAVWALLPCLAAIPFAFADAGAGTFTEGKLVELMQKGILVVAVVAAVLMAVFVRLPRICHRRTLLLGLFALACLARELDLHVALNPEHFGRYGVRYRIDWWLDGGVSLLLKLGWAAVLGCVVWVGVFLGRGASGPVDWRRARPRLFVLGLACYFVGFVFDDLMRAHLAEAVRQSVEETIELVATACILGAVLAPEFAARWRGDASLRSD